MSLAKPSLIPTDSLLTAGQFIKNVNINGNLVILGTTDATLVAGELSAFTNAIVTGTTNSTGPSTGSLIVAGGIGVNRNVTVGGTVKSTGLYLNEDENSKMGQATLSGGTVIVENTSITANSRIFLTVQSVSGTPGLLSLVKVVDTGFIINSTQASDASTVAYLIIEAY